MGSGKRKNSGRSDTANGSNTNTAKDEQRPSSRRASFHFDGTKTVFQNQEIVFSEEEGDDQETQFRKGKYEGNAVPYCKAECKYLFQNINTIGRYH